MFEKASVTVAVGVISAAVTVTELVPDALL
jgi:hypothetical protein